MPPYRDPRDGRKASDEAVVDIYKLSKFQRSNQSTCINSVRW
jgi:DNA-directed RNA polymerase beta subunit